MRGYLAAATILVRKSDNPAPGLISLDTVYRAVEACSSKEVELLCVVVEILVEDGARDVLAGLDSIRSFVHGKVAVLVGANKVVRL